VFGDTRPLPPGIIEVGGCTYKKPMPLPEVSTYIYIYDTVYGNLSTWADVAVLFKLSDV